MRFKTPLIVVATLVILVAAGIGWWPKHAPALPAPSSSSPEAEVPFWTWSRPEWERFCDRAGLTDPDKLSDVMGIIRYRPGTQLRLEVSWQGPAIEHVMVAELKETTEAERRVLELWKQIDPRMVECFEFLRDDQRKQKRVLGPLQLGSSGYAYGWFEINKAYVEAIHRSKEQPP